MYCFEIIFYPCFQQVFINRVARICEKTDLEAGRSIILEMKVDGKWCVELFSENVLPSTEKYLKKQSWIQAYSINGKEKMFKYAG